MVNVLVIGATGYIGQALCHSLTTSSTHRVYGLARTPAKAAQLAQGEVIPVLGSLGDMSSILRLASIISVIPINVIVDVSSAKDHIPILLQTLVGNERRNLEVAREERYKIPRLGFIYTSGTWLHGSSREPKNDLFPVGVPESKDQPPELLDWRPELERQVLMASDFLDTMVVRPALVYGRSSDIWSPYFNILEQSAKSGDSTVSLSLDPKSRPALIHVDDVGSGLHAAVDKLPLISGTSVYPVFDLVSSDESMRDIMEAAAMMFGFEGEVVLRGAGGDLFNEAMSVTANLDSGRAKELLGWQPKKIGCVDMMGHCVESWLAFKHGDSGANRYHSIQGDGL